MDFGQSQLSWEPKDLFGGVFRINIPNTFKDISSHVPISDNQEVFSDIANDAQLIIEILEQVDKPDQEAIQYNFQDLAEQNKAEDSIIVTSKQLSQTDTPNLNIQSEFTCFQLLGTQRIIPNKRLNDSRDYVTVFLFLLRLKQFESDILISLNVPDKTQGDQQNGESAQYKQLVQLDEFIFNSIIQSFIVPSEQALKDLYAVDQEMN